MKFKSLVLFLAVTALFSSCRATEPAGQLTSLEDHKKRNLSRSDVESDDHKQDEKSSGLYSGCFRITKAETDITEQDMAQVAKDTYRICISELISGDSRDKIIVDLKASSEKTLRSFRFKEAMAARCPGCYVFTESKDGSATFSETAVTTVSRLSINLKEYDGELKFMMLRELKDAETTKSDN
jgi:hypothetical protein